MKNKILSLTLGLVAGVVSAQDIHFSQFYMAPIQLNPGAAGTEADIRVHLNYKEQWKSVASPYKTIGGSYDMRFKKTKSGYFGGGIFFYSDRAGDARMGVAQGNLNLAYHLVIGQGQTLGLGVMGGYAQRSVNTTNMQWGNQYDGMAYNSSLPAGEIGAGNFSNSYLDLGTGLVYTYTQGEKNLTGNNQISATAGIAMFHVHKPDYSFLGDGSENLYRKFVIHGNSLFGIAHSRISVIPGFQYKIQGGARELVFGSSIRYRIMEDSHFTGFVTGSSLSLGFYYRNRDAVILTSLLQFGGYGIGISYDLNVSDLTQASNGRGGLEIALRYIYPSGNKNLKSSRFL